MQSDGNVAATRLAYPLLLCRQTRGEAVKHVDRTPESGRGLYEFIHVRFCTGIQELYQEMHMVSDGGKQALILPAACPPDKTVEPPSPVQPPLSHMGATRFLARKERRDAL